MRDLSRKNPLDIRVYVYDEKQNAYPTIETKTEDLRLKLSNIGHLSDEKTHIQYSTCHRPPLLNGHLHILTQQDTHIVHK